MISFKLFFPSVLSVSELILVRLSLTFSPILNYYYYRQYFCCPSRTRTGGTYERVVAKEEKRSESKCFDPILCALRGEKWFLVHAYKMHLYLDDNIQHFRFCATILQARANVSLVISLYNKIKLHIKSTEYKSYALYLICFFLFTSFLIMNVLRNTKF